MRTCFLSVTGFPIASYTDSWVSGLLLRRPSRTPAPTGKSATPWSPTPSAGTRSSSETPEPRRNTLLIHDFPCTILLRAEKIVQNLHWGSPMREKPWFRKQTKHWYVEIAGKQHKLCPGD